MSISRPMEGEYGVYYGQYIRRVPEVDLMQFFAAQIDTLRSALSVVSPAQEGFRHGPNEWTIKEVMGHMNDTERIFGYRALCISRNESKPLPGFEQDDYVRESNFNDRTLTDLLEEFILMRRSNILAFQRLPPDRLTRRGTMSEMPATTRAVLYVMAGHVEHHLESLRVDYFPKMQR